MKILQRGTYGRIRDTLMEGQQMRGCTIRERRREGQHHGGAEQAGRRLCSVCARVFALGRPDRAGFPRKRKRSIGQMTRGSRELAVEHGGGSVIFAVDVVLECCFKNVQLQIKGLTRTEHLIKSVPTKCMKTGFFFQVLAGVFSLPR
jgi:hypothetical protein